MRRTRWRWRLQTRIWGEAKLYLGLFGIGCAARAEYYSSYTGIDCHNPVI